MWDGSLLSILPQCCGYLFGCGNGFRVLLSIIKSACYHLTFCWLANVFRSSFDFIWKQCETNCTLNSVNYVVSKIFSPDLSIKEEGSPPGTMKLVKGTSSGITAFGNTNAPEDNSSLSGACGEEGFAVRITLAKWVGTETFGGEPMTSWVYESKCQGKNSDSSWSAHHSPLAIWILLG